MDTHYNKKSKKIGIIIKDNSLIFVKNDFFYNLYHLCFKNTYKIKCILFGVCLREPQASNISVVEAKMVVEVLETTTIIN